CASWTSRPYADRSRSATPPGRWSLCTVRRHLRRWMRTRTAWTTRARPTISWTRSPRWRVTTTRTGSAPHEQHRCRDHCRARRLPRALLPGHRGDPAGDGPQPATASAAAPGGAATGGGATGPGATGPGCGRSWEILGRGHAGRASDRLTAAWACDGPEVR